MATPRSYHLSAVLPDNQLMVVGGWTSGDKECDLVEIGAAFSSFMYMHNALQDLVICIA